MTILFEGEFRFPKKSTKASTPPGSVEKHFHEGPWNCRSLTFVISTEAKRSGEISVLTTLPGDVFRLSVAQWICGFDPQT
jgi:hypothetical protein